MAGNSSAIPVSERSLHLSNQFVISCGTVSLDLRQEKILLIKCRKTKEVLLPKGRKNIGESLQGAALRETYEETGYKVEILPLSFHTLATSAIGSEQVKVSEPVAVSQRVANDTLKIIFWFAAKVDSSMTPDKDTQQEGEDFDILWTHVENATSALTFDDDKRIARTVINVAMGSSRSHSPPTP